MKVFTSENLNDAFFLSNIREIWKTYELKRPEELKLFIEKETDLQYRKEQYKLDKLAKENAHSGFILHKTDINKVEDKHLFEIQGDRRMKYMNVFFSVPEEFMTKVRQELDPSQDLSTDEHQRSIIRIKAKKKKELTDETFISNRDKLVRLNRSKQDFRQRFVSPENRLGTQLRPLRSSKGSLVTREQIEEIQIRPETEKAHKRILSSGLSTSKQSTGLPSKILKGFGISGRTLYGKHTPLNFSHLSGAHTPANEYEETTKSWLITHKQNKVREEYDKRTQISKVREIEKIMKRLGKAEQDRNVTIFK